MSRFHSILKGWCRICHSVAPHSVPRIWALREKIRIFVFIPSFLFTFFPFLCIIKMLHYVVRKTWKKLHLLVTSSLDRIYNTCIYLCSMILHNVIHLVSIRFLCLYSYIFLRYNCIFHSILLTFPFLRFMDILETTQI